MLFMCTSKHTAEWCPGGTIHPDKDFMNKLKEAVDKSGVKMVEGFLDAPGHIFYLALDASDQRQLWNAIEPLRLIGEVNFSPVLKISEAQTYARETGIQR